MTQPIVNPWVFFPKKNPAAHVRLFCFPYAGGGVHIYYPWPTALPSWVEVVAIQLPGRGARLRDAPLTQVSQMADILAEQLCPLLDKPFAFFGHSLGATVAFEVMRTLRAQGKPLPGLFMPAGRQAPQLLEQDPPTYHLPDAEFIRELARLNGTPQAVLDNAELMDIVMPALRADFEAAETYEYQMDSPFCMPFWVCGGRQDVVNHTDEAMAAWRMHTQGEFASAGLPGEHFFIHSDEAQLLDMMTHVLSKTFKATKTP